MLINGERLKELRNEHGMTMKEVAQSLNVTEGTISRYEGGQIKRVSPSVLLGYSNLFHVPMSQLYQNPETEWVAAFSGSGMNDPRVRGFIEYLEEQAMKDEELSMREENLLHHFRSAPEQTKQIVEFALGCPTTAKED